MPTQTDLHTALTTATHAGEFETLARRIANAVEASPDLENALRARLHELNLDLPGWLLDYAETIMNAGEPSGEDISKVLSLTKSLDVLVGLGVARAEEYRARLGSALGKDGRYGASRASFFGTAPLTWWK